MYKLRHLIHSLAITLSKDNSLNSFTCIKYNQTSNLSTLPRLIYGVRISYDGRLKLQTHDMSCKTLSIKREHKPAICMLTPRMQCNACKTIIIIIVPHEPWFLSVKITKPSIWLGKCRLINVNLLHINTHDPITLTLKHCERGRTITIYEAI